MNLRMELISQLLPFTVNVDTSKQSITFVKELDIYLVVSTSEVVSIIENRCQHQRGRFTIDPQQEDLCLVCPIHGWTLNAPSGIKHKNKYHYEFEVLPSLGVLIKAIDFGDDQGTLSAKTTPALIAPTEYTVEYINHACCLIQTPTVGLLCDPWLFGSAFCSGWFLKEPTQVSLQSILDRTTHIYISHSHPDHMNYWTLRAIQKINSEILVLIPKFDKPDFSEAALKGIGFLNVSAITPNEIYSLGSHVSIQILLDRSGRNDSAVLVDYQGYTVLNLVDTSNIELPNNTSVDLLLSPFADGASGYPVCWEELYGSEEIKSKKKVTNNFARQKFWQNVNQFDARAVMPFAGYFASPLPQDAQIDSINTKNKFDDIKRSVPTYLADVKLIKPQSCVKFSVSTLAFVADQDYPTANIFVDKITSCSAEVYDIFIKKYYSDFSTDELLIFLDSCNFHDNLVVDFIATGESFDDIIWHLKYDFRLDSQDYYDVKPNYLRIKVRSYSLGYTVRNDLPWEEFTIGFQARFFRIPDVYNFRFWDYFQNRVVSNPYHFQNLLNLECI
jgi:CMP-N-acetylneuraminate monooxygenase